MEKMILDKMDLNILATLARDCRTSYRSIGLRGGLTPKSVKSRVKNLIRSGIIEKFIIRVNPAGFGYRTAHILVMRNNNNEIFKEKVIESIKQFGELAYHVHHMGRTTMAALVIQKPLDKKIIQSLNDSLKPAIVDRTSVSEQPVLKSLSETDLRIIKCLLLSGARTGISEIAKELGISEKTTTRRLDSMKEGHLVEFSIQCDPASMIGYIQFTILIHVEKPHYRSVYEHMYSEFQENILYHPSIIDPDDRLIFILFAENVFVIDFILAKVDSFEGVKKADTYILTKLQFYDEWLIREIDERLLSSHRPFSDKSIKTSSHFTQ
jgi:DNA-binding Lrp family transcriptional regulator